MVLGVSADNVRGRLNAAPTALAFSSFAFRMHVLLNLLRGLPPIPWHGAVGVA